MNHDVPQRKRSSRIRDHCYPEAETGLCDLTHASAHFRVCLLLTVKHFETDAE